MPPTTFSEDLTRTLQRAIAVAGESGREYAEPEDLLIALIDDPDAADILGGLQVDVARLRREVQAYMAGAKGELGERRADEPKWAPELRRIIQQALHHVNTIGRDPANGADVLIELIPEPVGHFLQQQGVTGYEVIRYRSHGVRKGDPELALPALPETIGPGASEQLIEVKLLNDDYTPMEFVVSLLGRVFEMNHEKAMRVMLETHETGAASCGTFPAPVALAKARAVLYLAREHQHPLQCVLERASPA